MYIETPLFLYICEYRYKYKMLSRIFIVVRLELFGNARPNGLRTLNVNRLYHWTNSDDESGVPLAQIKKTIKSVALNFLDGHACITIDCPICTSSKRQKEQPKVFINKTTGD